RVQDLLGEVMQGGGGAVVHEVAGADHLEAVVENQVAKLHRSLSSPRTDEGNTQLVDGEAEVGDLVEREAEPAGQAGGGDPRKAQEFSGGGHRQPDFIAHGYRSYQRVSRFSVGRRGDGSEKIAAMNVAVCVKQIPDPATPG